MANPGFFCEVIDSFLFLGSYYDACNFKKLEEFQINFILNVKDSCRYPPQPFELKHIPVDDYGRTNLIKDVFPKCFKFLEKVKENKGRVLIHCQSGVNRSASIVLAYLMTYRRMTFKEAFVFLRERRPIVSPHESYMKQLSEYETSIFGKSTFQDITFVPLQETLRKLRIVTDYRVIRGAFHTARDILTGTAVYTVNEEEEVREIIEEVVEVPAIEAKIPMRSSSSEPNCKDLIQSTDTVDVDDHTTNRNENNIMESETITEAVDTNVEVQPNIESTAENNTTDANTSHPDEIHRKITQKQEEYSSPSSQKSFTPPVRHTTSLGRWERTMNKISNSPKSSRLLVKVLKKGGSGSIESAPFIPPQ